jgi:UDP-glucose 4-epimerase
VKVLVSGATGFLGRAVTNRLLAEGHGVVAIVREDRNGVLPDGVARVVCDLTAGAPTPTAIGELDAVLHLAQSSRFRDFPHAASEVLAVGASASVGLATLAAEAGASRFVLASSGGVYAESPDPLSESSPLGPVGELDYYLTVKRVAEQLVERFRGVIGISILRYFFVYGPGQSPQMLVPRLVESVREGVPVALPGGRGPRVNPVYVTDAAAATVACLAAGAPEVLNVAGPEITDILGICDTVGELVGREPVFKEEEPARRDIVGATTLLDRIAPPRVGVREGIERLLDGG